MSSRFRSVALISTLQEKLNRIFDEAMELTDSPASENWQPWVDVIETFTASSVGTVPFDDRSTSDRQSIPVAARHGWQPVC